MTATSLLTDDRLDRADALSQVELTALVTRVAADDSWSARLRLPDGDRRWWTRLSSDARVDVWLLAWLPGQTTELHDHGDSTAAFTAARGLLTEVRVDAAGRPVQVTRRPGSATSLAPGVIHDVSGAGTGPAVSIHAYSPPLTRMNYYRSGSDGALHIARTVLSHEPEEELRR